MGADFSHQFVFWLEACQAFFDIAAFEEHQGGDAQHAILHQDVWVLVGIQLDHFYLPQPLLRQLFDDWVDHFAGLAPLSCKVHQHG